MSVIQDRRLLILTMAIITLAGVIAFLSLPRMEDPTISERAAMINTRLPGANVRRVDSLITEKLVDELRTFDEIKEIRSSSRASNSTIIVTLKDEIIDCDEVWARIRDKVSDARALFPPDALASEFEIIRIRAFSSIVALVWNSDRPPVQSVLSRTARELETAIRNVPSTEKVELFGRPEEEIVLEVNQTELARVGLTVDELAAQIAASDAKQPAGTIRGDNEEYLLEVAGELDSLKRISRIPIRSLANGQTCYVSDLAMVRKGIAEPRRIDAVVDGKPGIMIASSVLPNARIDYWTQDLNKTLEQFEETLPPDLTLARIFSQDRYVDARINYLVRDLIFSAFAVFAVVFVMMGWRSSLIVGLALPLSSCIVLACFHFVGIPLHQMSLSGLVIALGMLEGTAIIIVDEVRRRIREGESGLAAAKHGVAHMALPLFGSVSTTILSFLPIAIMPGPSGEFVGTIGTSVIIALIASLALSFTLLPSLTAISAEGKTQSSDTFWTRGLSIRWMTYLYAWSLRFFLARPALTVILGAAISLPGFLLLPSLPVQFFPSADRNQLHLELELSPQSSLEETRLVAAQAREILLADPEIARVDWVLGHSAPSFYYNMIGTRSDSANFAEALIQTHRTTGLNQLIRRLQRQLDSKITTAQSRLLQLEQGPPYDAPIEIRLFGNDEEALRAYGERVREILREHPEVTHTAAALTEFLPKLSIEVNEEESRLLEIPFGSIARQLNATIEGAVGGTVLEDNEELPVRVRLSSTDRNRLDRINAVDLLADSPGPNRNRVTLSDIGTATLKGESALIERFDGRRMNEVRAYLNAGVLPSTVLAPVMDRLEELANERPDGITIELGGESSKRDEAVGQLLGNVSMIAAAMVFVLVFSLKSFRAMATIMCIAAFAFGMAITSLWGAGFAFGFTAIVGAMGMVGIAINDSIVVLAELRADKRSLAGDLDAVLEIVMRATRHVLCTTFTVGCSFIPMFFEGGTFWPPMAMVITGGVFGATILALYWIPAVHLLNAHLFPQRAKSSLGATTTDRVTTSAPTIAAAQATDLGWQAKPT